MPTRRESLFGGNVFASILVSGFARWIIKTLAKQI
jgi:hypothetical protein